MNSNELHMRLTPETRYLSAVLALVREFGRTCGLTDDKLDHPCAAVREAVNLAVRYAPPTGEEPLQVRCAEIARGMAVSVIDRGRPARVDLDDFTAGPDAGSCLGSLLMHGGSDRIECRNLGMQGRELHMEFHVDGRTTPAVPQPVNSCDTSGDPKNEALRAWRPEDVQVGPMAADDALAVAQCIFSVYGYTYPKEDCYYPERLVKLHDSGEVHCAVARMPDGTVAGTGIIDRSTQVQGLFELSTLTTRQEYRCLGIARKVVRYLIAHETDNDPAMDGLVMESVTNHAFSQKLARENGFLTTGFFFGLVPGTVHFKGLAQRENSDHDRISSVLNVLRVSPWPEGILHVPQKHLAIIKKIYAQYKAPFSFSTKQVAPDEARHSTADTLFIQTMGLGMIRIETIGHDFPQLIRQRISQLKSRGVQVLTVYLNMLDPAAPGAVEELETHGFVFTGVLPGNKRFHPLLLQWFGALSFDTSRIQVNDETGRAVLQHIQAHDPTLSIV